ncbi:hypothetical protein BH11ARM2_BH11ARM2_09330 [soil metagenome]
MVALLAAVLLGAPAKISHPLLTDAFAKAKKEHKTVFVAFSASWCGPCRKLHGTLDKPENRKAFDRAFVDVEVIVLENDGKHKNTDGGMDLLTKLDGADEGIPFCAAISPDGTILADSRMKGPGTNMGCPMSKEEVAGWDAFLAKVPTLKMADRKVLVAAFQPDDITVPAHGR